jgi:membrane protein DedA with SNARE-associated domain
VLSLVDGWLHEHLLAVVFLGAIVDAIGIPFPGRIMLITAGSLSDPARHNGGATYLVIAFAVLGTVVGDHVWYILGRLMGRRVLDRYGRRIHLSPQRLATADHMLRRFGGLAIMLSRTAATLRVLVMPLAASRGMSYGRFLLFDLAGAVLWVGGFVWLGRAAGALGGVVGTVAAVASVAVATLLASLMFRRRWRSRRARAS